MMYTCICNAITEDDVQVLVKQYSTLNELLLNENIANCCQKCLDEIEQHFLENNTLHLRTDSI